MLKKGFTLVELLVVVMIVIILASVAIPFSRGLIMKARATEAVAALGAIRTQLEAVYAEYGNYSADGKILAGEPVINNVPGFHDTDLNGRYFDDDDYKVEQVVSDTFKITCSSQGEQDAPGADDVVGLKVEIDNDGQVTVLYNDNKI